ncbi:MAG: hypothetical protein R2784_14090 [Saprospiraceae bacterium]
MSQRLPIIADPNVSITLDETERPGACPQDRVITRVWTATDACGNASTASQVITLQDTQEPTLLGIPANVTVECDDIPNVPTNITATDNCDDLVDIQFTETTQPGLCENNFTIIRRWVATDDCGNTTIGNQRITVRDLTPPVLTGVPANVTVECDSVLYLQVQV